MAIIFFNVGEAGEVGENPRRDKLISSDSYATITTAGYLNASNTSGKQIQPTDIIDVLYNYTPASGFASASAYGTGTYAQFYPSFGAGNVITLVDTNAQQVGPQVVSTSVSSATPGTVRSLVGAMSESASVMTSGNIVGVRGSVNYVGASGGFIYGAQGKVIPTGTLSGSSWNVGVFGQLDISAATVNAGQMAPIWGDYGSASNTLTDQTGLYGIAMTNTTAAVLQGQIYLFGGAQNLLLLSTNAGLSGVTYFKDAGVSAGSWGNATPPTPSKVLKISVDGTAYYLPLVAQNT